MDMDTEQLFCRRGGCYQSDRTATHEPCHVCVLRARGRRARHAALTGLHRIPEFEIHTPGQVSPWDSPPQYEEISRYSFGEQTLLCKDKSRRSRPKRSFLRDGSDSGGARGSLRPGHYKIDDSGRINRLGNCRPVFRQLGSESEVVSGLSDPCHKNDSDDSLCSIDFSDGMDYPLPELSLDQDFGAVGDLWYWQN